MELARYACLQNRPVQAHYFSK